MKVLDYPKEMNELMNSFGFKDKLVEFSTIFLNSLRLHDFVSSVNGSPYQQNF